MDFNVLICFTLNQAGIVALTNDIRTRGKYAQVVIRKPLGFLLKDAENPEARQFVMGQDDGFFKRPENHSQVVEAADRLFNAKLIRSGGLHPSDFFPIQVTDHAASGRRRRMPISEIKGISPKNLKIAVARK
jgi:hypothetical protein